jgi:hypothetical protein
MDILNRIVLGLRGEVPRSVCPRLVVCNDHPSAAGRNNLVPVEAETGNVAEMSHHAFFVRCS